MLTIALEEAFDAGIAEDTADRPRIAGAMDAIEWGLAPRPS
jgi:hypothetical protein